MKEEMQEVNNIHGFRSVIDIHPLFERDYNLRARAQISD